MVHFSGYLISLMVYITMVRCQNLCSNIVGTRCDCTYNNGKLQVNCKAKSLTFVPTGIQQDAYIVDFSKNAITTIEDDDFFGLDNLHTLYLQENWISSIAKGAFRRLYKLSTLNLQINRLTEIPAGDFHYMPSLVSLDFSSNEITTIDKNLLIRLPKLGQLALSNNPLRCDCVMRQFKQTIDARVGNLLVLSGMCAGTNIKMTDATDSVFGNCVGQNYFRNITCTGCNNSPSTEKCIAQNFNPACTIPQHLQPTCFEEVVYVGVALMINKGCQTYSQCLERERNNDVQCYGKSEARCTFCCAYNECNKPAIRGRLHMSTYIVTAVLNGTMPDDLRNTNSLFYQNFLVAVTTQVDGILNHQSNSKGSFVSTITDIREPQVTVVMSIALTTIHEVQSNDRSDFIKGYLKSLIALSSYPIQLVDVVLSDQNTCNPETTEDSKGQYDWPLTKAGITAVVSCTINPSLKASRACIMNSGGNAEWAQPDTSICQQPSVTTSLDALSKTTVTSSNSDSVQSDLLTLTKESSRFSETDISLSVDVIENVLNEGSLYSNTQQSKQMVESMSNILNAPENAIEKSESTNKGSERFLKTVEKLANNVVPASSGFSAVNKNLALLVKQTNPQNFGGITMNADVQEGQGLDNNKVEVKDGEDLSSLKTGVVVPASLFNTINTNTPRFAFAVYGNNKMFKNVDASNLQTSANASLPNQVNGPVISTTLQKTAVNNLQRPFIFRFKHFNKDSSRPQCVFLDSTGTDFKWSSSGCSVKTHVPGSHTDCQCNHLTSFALLMDIYQTGGNISKANLLALTYISYIGCGVSLLGLLLTLLTYFMFRKLRATNPSKILINLCIALAITNVIFLIGMQEYTLDNDKGCKIVAVVLHYFLLSAITWMLVEAFYMYLALIKVFNTYFAHFLLKCCLFGWGVPLIIVGVTLGVNKTNNYGQQAGGICWLSPIPFYAAFLAPVGIILILNFITFFLVFRTIMRGTSKKIAKSDNKNSISQRLKGAFALVILLGLTWAFAIFAIGNGGIVFQYLFTIFNSLQGLFIFIFYCFFKTDARNAWKRKCGKGPALYTGPTTSKGKSSDSRSKDTMSSTFSSEANGTKKDFSDISRENRSALPHPESRSKRYPSYKETDT